MRGHSARHAEAHTRAQWISLPTKRTGVDSSSVRLPRCCRARIICMYGIVCGFNECVLSVVVPIAALMPRRLPLVFG
jgi:hypothetical protein